MKSSNIKWRFNVRRRLSWFVDYFQIQGTNQDVFQKVLGIDTAYSNMKKDADGNEFTDTEDEAQALLTIEEKTTNNFDFLRNLAEKSYEKSKLLTVTAQNIVGSKYNDIPLSEVKILFDELAVQLMEYQTIIFFIFPVEKYLEDQLAQAIKEKMGGNNRQEKWSEYMTIFSMPKQELVAIREEKSLLNIAIAKKEGKTIDKLLQHHLEKFAWIPTDDPKGKPWTENDLIERMNLFTEIDPEERLDRILKGEQEREEQFKTFQKELGLNRKTIEIIELVREYVYLRNYRVECLVQAQYHTRDFLAFIASKANITLNELLALSSDEISDFLENGTILNKKEIKRRLTAFAYVKIKGNYTAYFGEDAEKLGHFKEKEQKIEIKDRLTGTVASRGKTRGIVKIVNELADLPKVKKGDILVSSMTVPQYIPAMEKAGAFITDEGGITCHAAIISRELNIPCIINTKIATKILNDGDLVEVDAEKGIVRKLKS